MRFFGLLLILLFRSGFAAASMLPPAWDFRPASPDNVGFLVYDVEAKKTVYAHNQDKSLSYASNIKLITTLASLEELGGGFHFTTRFAYDPAAETLYIKAGGDPITVMEDVQAIAQELKERRIGPIRWVVVDDFLFGPDGFRPIHDKENGDRAFQAAISPLSLNYNTCQISVMPTELGDPPQVMVRTPGPYFTIQNNAKTVAGSGNNLIVSAGMIEHRTQISVSGSVGVDLREPVMASKKVHHPTEHYVLTLLYFLGINDATVSIDRQPIHDTLFKDRGLMLFTHESKPLRDILRMMNVHSSNPIAESLRYFLGAHLMNNPDSGVDALKQFARSKLESEIDITNGSGLGNGENFVKPSFMLKLLIYVYQRPLLSTDFFASLPVFGEEGTLERTFGFDQPGVFRAKSGLLNDVSALSGLMQGKSGKTYLFTFAVNNYPFDARVDRISYRYRFLEQVWEQL